MNTGIAPSTHKLTFPDHTTQKALPMKTQEPTGKTLSEVVVKNIAAFPEKTPTQIAREVDKTFNLKEGKSYAAYYYFTVKKNKRNGKPSTMKKSPNKTTFTTQSSPITVDELKFAFMFINTTGSTEQLSKYIAANRLGVILKQLKTYKLIEKQEFKFLSPSSNEVQIAKWVVSPEAEKLKGILS